MTSQSEKSSARPEFFAQIRRAASRRPFVKNEVNFDERAPAELGDPDRRARRHFVVSEIAVIDRVEAVEVALKMRQIDAGEDSVREGVAGGPAANGLEPA